VASLAYIVIAPISLLDALPISKRGQVLFSIIFVRTILSFCQELFCHVTFCAPRTLCSHPKTHAPNQNTHASTTANTREIIRRCPSFCGRRINTPFFFRKLPRTLQNPLDQGTNGKNQPLMGHDNDPEKY